jgi:hypothetical protein
MNTTGAGVGPHLPMIRLRWPHLSIRNTVLLAIAVAVLLPTLLLWHAEQRLARDTHEPLIVQGRQAMLTIAASALVEPLYSPEAAVSANRAWIHCTMAMNPQNRFPAVIRLGRR